MTLIKRSALVAYSSQQMFELVNAAEDYPQFLPWCKASHIIYRDDQQVEAKLEIVWAGVHQEFTTRNSLFPYKRIEITLVQGPFKQLEGIWDFIPLGEEGCKVELKLEFELTGYMVDMVFQPVFNHMANSFVSLFSKRALEVYGKPA